MLRQTLALMSVVAIALSLHSIWAQSEKRVTIELKDAPITEAFDQLFRAVGENFMLLPTVPTERRLTMRLTNVPFEKVLNFLCDLAGLKWERKDSIYVIGPKQPIVGVGAIGGAFIQPAVPQVAQLIIPPPMTVQIPKAFGFVGGTPTPELSRVYMAMAIFCQGCGMPVRRECPKCKNLMAWEWKFCPFDGTKLLPPPQNCPKCGRPLPKPLHLHPPAGPEQ